MTRRLPLLLAVLALSIGLSVAAVVHATHRPPSRQATVAAIAGSLRCPSCDAESVAASDAPIARSMEAEIRRQVAAGRSPQQVRSWFRARYGEQVLLVPDSHGPGSLLWLTPVLVGLAGVLAIGLVGRRRSVAVPDHRTDAASALSPRRVGLAAVCVLVVGAAVPVAVQLRSGGPAGGTASASATGSPAASAAALGAPGWVALGRSMDRQHDYAGAVRAYRKALRLAPGSASVRTQLAFDLVRTDRPAEAASVVRTTARQKGPDRAAALLVLGLSQRARSQASARQTFRTFLAVAPHHPAAGQVRRLLQEGS